MEEEPSIKRSVSLLTGRRACVSLSFCRGVQFALPVLPFGQTLLSSGVRRRHRLFIVSRAPIHTRRENAFFFPHSLSMRRYCVSQLRV